jgi:hypothetical protein
MTEQLEDPERELVIKLFENVESEFSIQFDSMWDANAMKGNFISKFIAAKYRQVDAVDIHDYSEAYQENLAHPNAKFHVMDNRDFIKNCTASYDLILMEGPLCEIAGETAEHFGMMDRIVPLTREKGITVLIFNSVLEPYDYDAEKNRRWREIRNKFYGRENTAKISWQFMTAFYINYLMKIGLDVLYYDRVVRRSLENGDRFSIDLNLAVVERVV